MTANSQERLVSVKDTAELYGCSVATVWRHVADKRIPQPVKIGGMTRWSLLEILSDIESAKAKRQTEAA